MMFGNWIMDLEKVFCDYRLSLVEDEEKISIDFILMIIIANINLFMRIQNMKL